MSLDDTLRALLAEAGKPALLREARAAWVRRTAAAWREAQRQMDERCDDAVDRLSEEAFERLCDEEEAKVDALYAQLRAVIDEDKWPKELYFRCV